MFGPSLSKPFPFKYLSKCLIYVVIVPVSTTFSGMDARKGDWMVSCLGERVVAGTDCMGKMSSNIE